MQPARPHGRLATRIANRLKERLPVYLRELGSGPFASFRRAAVMRRQRPRPASSARVIQLGLLSEADFSAADDRWPGLVLLQSFAQARPVPGYRLPYSKVIAGPDSSYMPQSQAVSRLGGAALEAGWTGTQCLVVALGEPAMQPQRLPATDLAIDSRHAGPLLWFPPGRGDASLSHQPDLRSAPGSASTVGSFSCRGRSVASAGLRPQAVV